MKKPQSLTDRNSLFVGVFSALSKWPVLNGSLHTSKGVKEDSLSAKEEGYLL